MHGRVEGKTALITGGGSGLGREAAMHLAEEGANIVVSDLNEDTAQATADEINAQRQGAAVAARHDVSSEDLLHVREGVSGGCLVEIDADVGVEQGPQQCGLGVVTGGRRLPLPGDFGDPVGEILGRRGRSREHRNHHAAATSPNVVD